jgi:hypothetical protein
VEFWDSGARGRTEHHWSSVLTQNTLLKNESVEVISVVIRADLGSEANVLHIWSLGFAFFLGAILYPPTLVPFT